MSSKLCPPASGHPEMGKLRHRVLRWYPCTYTVVRASLAGRPSFKADSLNDPPKNVSGDADTGEGNPISCLAGRAGLGRRGQGNSPAGEANTTHPSPSGQREGKAEPMIIHFLRTFHLPLKASNCVWSFSFLPQEERMRGSGVWSRAAECSSRGMQSWSLWGPKGAAAPRFPAPRPGEGWDPRWVSRLCCPQCNAGSG